MKQSSESVSAQAERPHASAEQALAAADDTMAALVERFGPCTLGLRQREPFPTLCSAIIGQQISARAAATVEARLVEALGGALAPERIQAASDAVLRAAGLSAAKARYLRALTEASEQITLSQLAPLADREVMATLTRIHGVGPWTAEMFLIFVLHRPDVFSMGDVGLRNAVNRLYAGGQKLDAKATRQITERWSPWRSIGSWYLWRLTDGEVGTWQ